jgi:hypothetical protein
MLTDEQVGQWLLAISDGQIDRLRAYRNRDVLEQHSFEFWNKSLQRAAGGADDPIEVLEHVLELAERGGFPARHEMNRLLTLACAAGNLRCVQRLIARDAFVFSSDTRKRNCLTIAAARGHLDIVQALIRAGSAIDLVDKNGNTALYHAVEGLHENVITYLRGLGTDANHRNEAGQSPMTLAEGLPEIQMPGLRHSDGARTGMVTFI